MNRNTTKEGKANSKKCPTELMILELECAEKSPHGEEE